MCERIDLGSERLDASAEARRHSVARRESREAHRSLTDIDHGAADQISTRPNVSLRVPPDERQRFDENVAAHDYALQRVRCYRAKINFLNLADFFSVNPNLRAFEHAAHV